MPSMTMISGDINLNLKALRFFTGSNWLAYDYGHGCHIDLPPTANEVISCDAWASTTDQSTRLVMRFENMGSAVAAFGVKLIVKANQQVVYQSNTVSMPINSTIDSGQINLKMPNTALIYDIMLQNSNGDTMAAYRLIILNTLNPNGLPVTTEEPNGNGGLGDDDPNNAADIFLDNLINLLSPYVPGLNKSNWGWYAAGFGLIGLAFVLGVYTIARRRS